LRQMFRGGITHVWMTNTSRAWLFTAIRQWDHLSRTAFGGALRGFRSFLSSEDSSS
jgi:hypothetical protein